MASIDISPEIGRTYKKIVSSPVPNKPSPTYAQWAVYSVSAPLQNAFLQSSTKASVLKVHSAGEGELEDLVEEFNDGKVQFAFVKVKDPNTSLSKFVLICWCGEGVPERVKGYFTGHLSSVSKVLHGYHVQVSARSDSDLSPESIIQKVVDASGTKYSSSSPSITQIPKKPITPAKPTIQPTISIVGASHKQTCPVDKDGWGADAPPVTRSQLEIVPSAYKPTRVDINVLRAQPTSTTSGHSKAETDEREVVKGGYQPVGKVDIAALRRGYEEKRPEPVKGAYRPVEVVIPKKQTISSDTEQRSQPDKSIGHGERLTSLPKPKASKKFGPGAPNYGTKPLTPGGFGLGSAPNLQTAPQVGAINKTGITKSPAQIWAEKKARERGSSTAGGTGVFTAETPNNPDTKFEVAATQSGDVTALRHRFAENQCVSPLKFSEQRETSSSISDAFKTPSAIIPAVVAVDAGIATAAVTTHDLPNDTESYNYQSQGPSSPVERIPTPPTQVHKGSPVLIAMPVAREERVESLEEELEPPQEPNLQCDKPVSATSGSKLRAVIQYDYDAAEDNEISLEEGGIVSNIEMVDDDWWMGTNSAGQQGLFPSNYVELINEDHVEELVASPTPHKNPEPKPEPEEAVEEDYKATALYDYEATEDNELTFAEGAIIENIQFPDKDWWAGTYKGKEGLFPANYVELHH